MGPGGGQGSLTRSHDQELISVLRCTNHSQQMRSSNLEPTYPEQLHIQLVAIVIA
jgi:hypothetical protein